MSQTTHTPPPTPPPPSAPQDNCGCPSESNGSNADAQHAALISADVDVGTSGANITTDLLGNDFIDASIGLGAVDDLLGLVDSKLGLVDSILCDIA